MSIQFSPGACCCKKRGPICITTFANVGLESRVIDLTPYAGPYEINISCSPLLPHNILCPKDIYWAIASIWSTTSYPSSARILFHHVGLTSVDSGKNVYGNIVNGVLVGFPESLTFESAGTMPFNSRRYYLQTGHKIDENTIRWGGGYSIWTPGVYDYVHYALLEEPRMLTPADFTTLEGGSGVQPTFASVTPGAVTHEQTNISKCKYATPTAKPWGKSCFTCTVIKCRSPKRPPITDLVAAHLRYPVNTDGSENRESDHYEVRSKYCNPKCCSLYEE